jgi:predicted DsbA family dithiol-disulfide isomerase
MAVPAFVFAGKLLVSGAVPREVLGRAIARLSEMR